MVGRRRGGADDAAAGGRRLFPRRARPLRAQRRHPAIPVLGGDAVLRARRLRDRQERGIGRGWRSPSRSPSTPNIRWRCLSCRWPPRALLFPPIAASGATRRLYLTAAAGGAADRAASCGGAPFRRRRPCDGDAAAERGLGLSPEEPFGAGARLPRLSRAGLDIPRGGGPTPRMARRARARAGGAVRARDRRDGAGPAAGPGAGSRLQISLALRFAVPVPGLARGGELCLRFDPARLRGARLWLLRAVGGFAGALLIGGWIVYGVFTIHPRQQEPLARAAQILEGEWRARYACGPAYVMGDFWSAYGTRHIDGPARAGRASDRDRRRSRLRSGLARAQGRDPHLP